MSNKEKQSTEHHPLQAPKDVRLNAMAWWNNLSLLEKADRIIKWKTITFQSIRSLHFRNINISETMIEIVYRELILEETLETN